MLDGLSVQCEHHQISDTESRGCLQHEKNCARQNVAGYVRMSHVIDCVMTKKWNQVIDCDTTQNKLHSILFFFSAKMVIIFFS